MTTDKTTAPATSEQIAVAIVAAEGSRREAAETLAAANAAADQCESALTSAEVAQSLGGATGAVDAARQAAEQASADRQTAERDLTRAERLLDALNARHAAAVESERLAEQAALADKWRPAQARLQTLLTFIKRNLWALSCSI